VRFFRFYTLDTTTSAPFFGFLVAPHVSHLAYAERWRVVSGISPIGGSPDRPIQFFTFVIFQTGLTPFD
jgi:hypothetical protein